MKKTNPLVSIVMPVYNEELLVKSAIRSLFHQTYQNWECIIVDDGSTDSTFLILSEIADSRIKLFRFENNKGRPYARQKALEEANGKYLAMLDADDWYYNNKLELQVDLMERNQDWILLSSGLLITNNKSEILGIQLNGSKLIEEYSFGNPLKYFPVPHASSIIRMKDAKKVKYDFELLQSQDQDFMIRLLKGRKYAILNTPLYVYNLGDSMNSAKYRKSQISSLKIWRKQLGLFNFFYVFKCITTLFKIVLSEVLNIFGQFKILNSRRGVNPDVEQISDFESQKEINYSKHSL